MRERDHGAVAVEIEFSHHVVRHAAFQFRTGHIPGIGIFFARITHHHVVIQRLPHLREVLRQLPCPDNQNTPARAVNGDKRFFVERKLIRIHRRFNGGKAAFHIKRALHQFVTLNVREQFIQTAFSLQRLQHEFECAAARQTEALRFFSRYAVLRGRRLILHQFAVTHAQNHVVLNTAAGYGTDHHAIVAYRGKRADGPRCRAPGFHHSRHHYAMPGFHPVAR